MPICKGEHELNMLLGYLKRHSYREADGPGRWFLALLLNIAVKFFFQHITYRPYIYNLEGEISYFVKRLTFRCQHTDEYCNHE
jgi:hypothetical protein